MKDETPLQRRILLRVGARPDVRLFRNNVGAAWQGDAQWLHTGTVLIPNPRRVVYGLAPGSSDLIGWRTVTITPAMVGLRLPVFTAVEVKTGQQRPSKEQRNFIAAVQAAGGIAGTARSVEEAERLVLRPMVNTNN